MRAGKEKRKKKKKKKKTYVNLTRAGSNSPENRKVKGRVSFCIFVVGIPLKCSLVVLTK